MVFFKQHCRIKYIYLQHFLDVQILILQILILQHSNHVNSLFDRSVCSYSLGLYFQDICPPSATQTQEDRHLALRCQHMGI